MEHDMKAGLSPVRLTILNGLQVLQTDDQDKNESFSEGKINYLTLINGLHENAQARVALLSAARLPNV
jgi:hypothetical protein